MQRLEKLRKSLNVLKLCTLLPNLRFIDVLADVLLTCLHDFESFLRAFAGKTARRVDASAKIWVAFSNLVAFVYIDTLTLMVHFVTVAALTSITALGVFAMDIQAALVRTLGTFVNVQFTAATRKTHASSYLECRKS